MNSVKYALFAFSGGHFVLPIDKVIYILPAPQIFPLPGLRDWFDGVLVYQDEIVPHLALGRMLDVGAMRPAGLTIICQAEYGLIGLPADQVQRIEDAGQVEIGDSVQNDEIGHRLHSSEGTGHILLDVDRLMADILQNADNAENKGGLNE